MSLPAVLESSLSAIGLIVVAMAVVAALETVWPLRAREPAQRAHLAPNLALTALTFVINAAFNVALVVVLVRVERTGSGLLERLAAPALLTGALVIVALDLSFYAAHVAMHRSAPLWRFHRVHHSDPAVDVTTTIRQHPGEGVIRYAFLAAAAVAIGAPPGAFAVYRVWSALNGLLEHANLKVPRRLDRVLALVVVTPDMHKLHHSRSVDETDSNYGNVFSVFDRLFSTFTPTSARAASIAYGLDGFDAPEVQTTRGLLALPFREPSQAAASHRAPRGDHRARSATPETTAAPHGVAP